MDVELPGRVCCLPYHGLGLLSWYLEPQLLTLLAYGIEHLLHSLVFLAPASDDKGKVVSVAQQGGVLGEGQGNELLHQQVEEAEDAALECPILQLLEVSLLALEFNPEKHQEFC
ncbi:hypothetical protein E2C01_019188 [Portunus trituberculatus]|uniref:Uncharacterized protein n=1 Tax=Portunus trituberculatus TaxID=210409 RepID=A0A5B7DYC7_PORTR|nr:hypothetical protein [Portunus trituberculatus]